MSRVGRVPVEILEGVKVTIDQNMITIIGSKGELSLDLHKKIQVVQEGNLLVIKKKKNDKLSRSLHGLTQRLISNMIVGVTKGFEKKLEVKGVGYRVQVSGNILTLNVGYSHPVEMKMPQGVEVKVQKNIITVSGIDKQKVGQTAAKIREVRKPEPYKGKGIRYIDEIVKRKAGKTAAKTTGSGA